MYIIPFESISFPINDTEAQTIVFVRFDWKITSLILDYIKISKNGVGCNSFKSLVPKCHIHEYYSCSAYNLQVYTSFLVIEVITA